ncbi:histidine kinase [Puteibacter caeruleilacunae]|nr:histidine kinase [Puteibacter caeruleilacunae]
MKTFTRYIAQHKQFILFLFVFSWIITLKNKIGQTSFWGEFTFHFDTPIWVFINAFIIFFSIDIIKRKSATKVLGSTPTIKSYLMYLVIGFICYLVYINVFGLTAALVFGTFTQNFGSATQVLYLVFNQTIDFLIFGGFSLAYLYYLQNKEYQQRISDYDISLSKSKIKQLKAQLNPHFLFNNLNILDQLIDEDQDKASDFLSDFSDLYRYALSSSDKELISLQDELAFAENYFSMMEHKYQGYYQLRIADAVKDANAIVPPFCLQVLIENAVAHNLGTADNPVIIDITTDEGIKITNNRIALSRSKKGNGIALKNLSKQFELLTSKQIVIKQDQYQFSVTLPLINMYRND